MTEQIYQQLIIQGIRGLPEPVCYERRQFSR
jgi:hypothetical protein